MVDPSASELGQRVLRQERAAFAELGRSVLTALEAPAAGSPRAQDLGWIHGRSAVEREHLGAVAYGLMRGVADILRSADEHVQALELVVSADSMLPIPALTLARAVQEAAILVCYLADPAATPPQRLVRGAALQLHAAQENQKTQRLFGKLVSPELAHRADEGLHGVQKFLTNAGLKLTYDRAGQYVVAVTCDGVTAPVRVNTTELSKRYIADAHSSWVLGSGAPHSRTWLTQGLQGPWAILVAAVVMLLLDIADALTDTMCDYIGQDAGESHSKTHLRRIALSRRAGRTAPVGSWQEYAGAGG